MPNGKPGKLLQIFPEKLRRYFSALETMADCIQEIRIRVNRPVIIQTTKGEWFITEGGEVCKKMETAICFDEQQLFAMLEYLCRYSVYAFEDEIKRGFLTIPGGHRIGLAGQVILDDENRIRNIKHISFMNIRIAHEIQGVSDKVLPYVYTNGCFQNTLIISPPGCGKTTMLRDLVRNISNGSIYGEGLDVSVIDERSEIAGSFMGIAQNDVGMRTDVLDGCPKSEGMMLMVRSMAPKVLALDELGSQREIQGLLMASGCGCRILATIHGGSFEEIYNKSFMRAVFEEKVFRRFLVLGKRNEECILREVLDEKGEKCLS